jgi:hypothetical protein
MSFKLVIFLVIFGFLLSLQKVKQTKVTVKLWQLELHQK